MAESIAISFTSISSRVSNVHKVVESLLSQTGVEDVDIYLYLSKEPYLLDEGVTEVPIELELLTKENRFYIEYVKNIGPYRKIIPVLSRIFSGEKDYDFVVTVDDDTVYPDTWLKDLLVASREYDCVVGYRGRQITLNGRNILPYRKWLHSNEKLLEPSLNTVCTGKDGVCYRPEYFHRNVLNISDALDHCGHADDLWLKLHTASLGVPSVLLSSCLSDAFIDLGESDAKTLYREFNKKGGNDMALRKLLLYFREHLSLDLLDVFDEGFRGNATWLSSSFTNTFLDGKA